MTVAAESQPIVSKAQDRSRCVVCGGADKVSVEARSGEIAYCLTCFHGWRAAFSIPDYTVTDMCATGQEIHRLELQLDFIAPYAPPGAKLFEVGCATGELAALARQRMDISRFDAIEMAPAKESARPHLDNLYEEILPDLLRQGRVRESYNVVIMSHVLEHLEEPKAEVRAMKAILDPGGVIFIEVPNRSGSLSLAIDDNPYHLSFFTPSSLTRLLAQEGLESIDLRTGVRLHPEGGSFYDDLIQVIARPFTKPQWSHSQISDMPALASAGQVVVWGVGGLAQQLIGNYFDVNRIDFFIDRNLRKQGTVVLGKPVRGPEALGEAPRTVLINSVDFADDIAADIAALPGGNRHKVVRIGDLIKLNRPR